MKTSNTQVNVIERDNVTGDKGFGIVFDAKMAKILADGLYSDKIKSIIRELSCNAWDAHVAAKHRKPFEVHLPSQFAPHFEVRDYGTGLSVDDVSEVYTTYGKSTKSDSNDFTGQLGLGSKSPFSYTDAFSVVSRYNGIETHYSMYKNETGMPSMAILGSNPTDLANGVAVRFPVKREDIQRFAEKAVNVFSYFPVKPIFTGTKISGIEPKYDDYFAGSFWKIVTDNGYSRARYQPEDITAVMGNVAYPISYSSLPKLNDSIRNLFKFDLVINFKIGDLEVSASRESLGYDPRTSKNIIDRLESLHSELKILLEKRLDGCKTLWEAKQAYSKTFDGSIGYTLKNSFNNHALKWSKGTISNEHIEVALKDFYDTDIVNLDAAGKKLPATHDIRVYQVSGRHTRSKTFTKLAYRLPYGSGNFDNATLTLTPIQNPFILFDDTDNRTGPSRASYWLTESAEVKKNPVRVNQTVMFGPSDKMTWDKMKEKLGNPEVIMVSSLPKPPVKKRNKAVADTANMSLLCGNGAHYYSVTRPDVINVKLDDASHNPGLFVYLDERNACFSDNDHTNSVNITDLYNIAIQAKIIDSTRNIFGAKLIARKKLVDRSNWMNFVDFVISKVRGNMTEQELANLVYAADISSRGGMNGAQSFYTIGSTGITATLAKLTDQTSSFVKFLESIKTIIDLSQKANKEALPILRMLRVTSSKLTCKPNIDYHETYRVAHKDYPLLSFINKDFNATKHIIDYVNLVDADKAAKKTTKKTP
jgi:hypothetical protein